MDVECRAKPAFFIELAIVWQECFRYDANDDSLLNHNCAVEKYVAYSHRHTHDRNDVEFT